MYRLRTTTIVLLKYMTHILQQYINGGGLDTLLTDTTIHLSWSDKIGFALDVAKGMEYLHSNHVFHRDLKSTVSEVMLYQVE